MTHENCAEEAGTVIQFARKGQLRPAAVRDPPSVVAAVTSAMICRATTADRV